MGDMRSHRYYFIILLTLALFLLCLGHTARAVRPGEVSWTAEAVTAWRAIAAMDPDEKIRCTDFLAVKFVRPEFWRYSAYSPDFDLSQKWIKALRIGTYHTVNARTKHTDATLEKMAPNGLQQVVVLGAGFDTRAYRYADRFPHVRFFEMDLPATIADKEKMAKMVLDNIPASLAYVPIDFNTQSIGDALSPWGYNENAITLFIWEGVSYYISKDAVQTTLNFVAHHSAPGSAIIFDYMPAEIARRDFAKYPDARIGALRCAIEGEPWIFGFEEGQAPAFVNKCGLQVLADMDPKAMVKKYLMDSNGKPAGKPASFISLMHAVVP